MNRLILLIVIVGISEMLRAQTIEITYRTSKTRYSLEEYIDKFVKTDNQGVIQMISSTYGKTPTFDFQLLVSKQKALYSTCDVDAKTFLNADGERKTLIKPSVNDIYYKDLNQNDFHAKVYFNDSEYFINGEIPKQTWVLSEEYTDILGYRCQKAMLEEYRGWEITAYFTTDIPVSIGPKDYGGLPGVILRIEKGAELLTAVDVELRNENTELENKMDSKDSYLYSWPQFMELEKKAVEFRKQSMNAN